MIKHCCDSCERVLDPGDYCFQVYRRKVSNEGSPGGYNEPQLLLCLDCFTNAVKTQGDFRAVLEVEK